MSSHTAVLLLGSNVDARESLLRSALSEIGRIAVCEAVSPVCYSPDVARLGNDYANITARFVTDLTLCDFCNVLAEIEQRAGRTPSSKYLGIMPLDIDVVIWDNSVVSPDDFSRPYFARNLA